MYLDVISKEVLALAEHHRDVLKRRFPHHEHYLRVPRSDDYCWLRLDTMACRRRTGDMILMATFYHSSINIASRFNGRIIGAPSCNILRLNYADPNFTDDIIFKIVEEYDVENII